MKFPTCIFAVVVLAALSAATAEAGVIWSMNAGACRPDHNAVTNDNFESGGLGAATLAFKGTNTSTVQLYCPLLTLDQIFGSGTTMLYLGMGGLFSTGDAAATARLMRVSKASGAETTLNATVSISSSDVGPTSKFVVNQHQFDFVNYFYYVRIELTRSITTANIFAYHVWVST